MIHGEPPIIHEDYSQSCPRCGSKEIISGYGLAFGGLGSCLYCANDECDWYYKDDDYLEDNGEVEKE